MGRIARALVIASLVMACDSTAPTTGSPTTGSPPSGATGNPVPSFGETGLFDPVALAEAVVSADTDVAREAAIVAALASIGLGVWTAEGEPIVAGAERTSTDFIVYDFEITALSGGVADGDDAFLDDIAAELSTVNAAAGGDAFTPAVFAAAVTTATADAMTHPERHEGYALRLARELGVRRSTPVDLAEPPGPEPIVLDPLAGFLVAADLALPRILAADPPPVASIGRTASAGGTTWLTAADPCARFRAQIGTSWHAGSTVVPGARGDNASFSRSLQARLVGATVKIGGQYSQSWHHRHKGEQPQAEAYFVGLQVRVQVPQRINCGPISFSNGQMEGGGAVVGAEVTWTHPGLEHHATFDCQAPCQRTNEQGVASLQIEPIFEAGPGGIGPEFRETVSVTAEVNLYKALGPDLFGILDLPPDMRLFARKQMPTDITWHRAFEVSVLIDSKLYVNKAQSFEYQNHVGTATATGVIDVKTVRRPNDVPDEPPVVGSILTITDKGTGPLCAPGVVSFGGVSGPVLGSITYKADSRNIPFQAIDAVIYPWEKLYLYLDVGPGVENRTVPARLVQCDPNTGKVVADFESPSTNLWEATIFRGYPRGLSFTGAYSASGGPVTSPVNNIWNLRASPQDWAGTAEFVVASWESPQSCGGNCDPNQSWLKLSILAKPLPDP